MDPGPRAAILYFSGYFDSSAHGSLALATIIGLYPLTFLSVFFNVALAGGAALEEPFRRRGSEERRGATGG